MQIQDEVEKSFTTVMVKGKLVATVIDIHSDEPFSFDPRTHMLHIFTASLNNVDGEAAGFVSGRGGETYAPVLVCGRFAAHLPSCYLDVSHAPALPVILIPST